MTKEEKCSNTQKGRIVIHKDNIEKRIYKEELDYYLNNGWIKGHKYSEKRSESLKGKNLNNTNGFKKGNKPWNYGKRASDNPKLQAALDKAHASSREKGPWNKGLTKELDSRIIGRPLSNLHKKKISNGHKNSNKLSEYLINRTPEQKNIQVTKSWLTKKKNGTTNTSKSEELLYEKLLKENENKTIYRNYKCDRYPYHCDFYIVEDDLFIELNAHWTHGGRPFDKNDFSCQKQLELWEEKAKTSQFYKNAIITWTKRDVEKAKCAKENKLNYWVIY